MYHILKYSKTWWENDDISIYRYRNVTGNKFNLIIRMTVWQCSIGKLWQFLCQGLCEKIYQRIYYSLHISKNSLHYISGKRIYLFGGKNCQRDREVTEVDYFRPKDRKWGTAFHLPREYSYGNVDCVRLTVPTHNTDFSFNDMQLYDSWIMWWYTTTRIWALTTCSFTLAWSWGDIPQHGLQF